MNIKRGQQNMKKMFDVFLQYVKKTWKQLVVLLSLLVTSIVSICIANGIQTNFGKIKVESGVIETKLIDSNEKVNIGFKIYIPKEASATNKLPAAL